MNELFQVMLEYLLDEDKENTIYTLRELADDLEEGAELTSEEVIDILQSTLQ